MFFLPVIASSSLNAGRVVVLDEVGPVDTEVYGSPWQLTRSDRLGWIGHSETITIIYRRKVNGPLIFLKNPNTNFFLFENQMRTLIKY